MNVTPREKKTELHDWIDAEVPQMIDERVGEKNTDITFDEEALKEIEKEVTKLLKQYFK